MLKVHIMHNLFMGCHNCIVSLRINFIKSTLLSQGLWQYVCAGHIDKVEVAIVEVAHILMIMTAHCAIFGPPRTNPGD